ncbi:MAG: hypothetical protein ACOCSD_00655 [Halolamina sp.]
MTAWERVRRPLVLTGAVLLLSVFLIGLQTNTLRYEYGSVPIPYLVVLAPLAGLVAYQWVRDLREALLLLVGVVAVTGVGTVAVLSAPVFLQSLSIPEQNLLVGNALGESLLFTALSLVLVAAGMAVAALLSQEFEVGLPPRGSVAVAMALLLVGGALVGTIGLNFSSAVEQRDVEATVESVDGDGDEVIVSLDVANRLRAPLEVESVTLRLGSGTPVSVTDFPDVTIPPDDRRTVTVHTTCGELAEDGLDETDDVTVRGQVQTTAFNEYDARIPVAESTVDLGC